MDISGQLKQLNDARKLALSDPTFYPQIITAVLPIVGPAAKVELRRWGADFLAETFSNPLAPAEQKETMCLGAVLDTLKAMIENPQEDAAVVKSVVQAAASIYPLVFRWIINNSWDTGTWETMTAIKQRILRIWDSSTMGVRICCVKFAQRIVLVGTTGPPADPKRGDPMEVSLSLVPQNHPLLSIRNLEAESSGLLDRVLGVFQESLSDAVIVDATLNSLSILIRAGPNIANKILNIILNFNPLKQANSPMTPKLRVMVKSMEKTTRSLLTHIYKRDPQNPIAPKIQQYVERMLRSKTEIFDDASRKRTAPEPVNGLDAKRQKLAPIAPRPPIPPLAPGKLHTIAELFTVTTDDNLKNFDVSILQERMVVKIGISILQRISADDLNHTIDGIRQRYDLLAAPPPAEVHSPIVAPLGIEDDDDDYDPDFEVAEDIEQILNKLDIAPPENLNERPQSKGKELEKVQDTALKQFSLPAPPPLTEDQAMQFGEGTISKVFGVMQTLDEPGKKTKSGLNRLGASAYDRDAWVTIITRLATRSSAGLGDPGVKGESDPITLSNTIRISLFNYIIADFRKRIDVAVAWLCEEWYNDKILAKSSPERNHEEHYNKWVIRVLDGIVPYLDKGDKVLIRFLGEIPALTAEVLDRVKPLCRDPTMVNLALTSLLYLILMRPPVREIALDAVEDIWNTYEDAKPIAAKTLAKYRPGWQERLKGPEEEVKKDDAEAENGS